MSSIAAEAKKKNQSSNIFFTKEESIPIQKSIKFENKKASLNIFKEDETSNASGNKATKFYNKSDIFNVSGANQKTQTPNNRLAPSTKTDIFFENSEKEKKVSNKDLNPYDRHGSEFLLKLKKLNPPEVFDKASILKPSGLLNNENNIDNKVRMKIVSDPKISAKERKLIMNSTTINPAEVQVLKTKHSEVASLVEKVTSEALITSKVVETKSKIFIDPSEDQGNDKYKPHKKQFTKDRVNDEFGYFKEATNNLDGGNVKFDLNKASYGGADTYEINDIDNFKTHKISEIEKEFRNKG
jgi:hypothetical protein